jgi:hypothetical protein
MSDQENSKATNTVKVKAEKTKPITAEEFITRWPLYTPATVDVFYAPSRVNFHCDDPCGKETTWLKTVDSQYVSLEAIHNGFKYVPYLCGLCNKNYLVVLYRELEHEDRVRAAALGGPRSTIKVITKVQKIGQFPAQSIDVPKGLEKSLGSNAISLYKRD